MKSGIYVIFLIGFHLFSVLFAFPQINQSRQFDREKRNLEITTLKNSTEQKYKNIQFNKAAVNLAVNGSPFNINDNPQIDSVVTAKLLYGDTYETIKYFYEYDSLGNVGIEIKTQNYKLINTFDQEGNKLNFVWQTWENTQWINYALASTKYDSTGKKLSELFQLWDKTKWIDNSRSNFFYHTNGDLSYYLIEDWSDSNWVNSFRVTYDYNSDHMVINRLNQNWGNDDWNGVTWRDSYSYDQNGNLVMHLSEDLENHQWVNDIRWRYEYDENNNNTLTFYDYWENGEWKDDYRWTEEYDTNGNVIYYLEETYNLGHWNNSYQTFSTYNSDGHFTYANSERWLETDSIWVPGNEGVFIYDKEGNRRSYFGAEIEVYYHDEPTHMNGNESLSKNYFLSQNYPNPFNPVTSIEYQVGSSERVTIKVYDMLGREVTTLINKEMQPGSYEVKFDGSNLSSGIYFYRLQAGNFVQTRKMMLLK